jgi:hypothetical protein
LIQLCDDEEELAMGRFFFNLIIISIKNLCETSILQKAVDFLSALFCGFCRFLTSVADSLTSSKNNFDNFFNSPFYWPQMNL